MNLLVAASPPNLGPSRTFYDLARLQSMTQWWHWMLLLVICVGLIIWVVSVYRRDTRELPRGVGVLLLLLRISALAGLLLFFLQLEKRTERKLVKPSRVAVLVDTSQSMGLADAEEASGAGESRLAQIVRELSDGSLIDQLRDKHEVTFYRFDQEASPESIATFPKRTTADSAAALSQIATSTDPRFVRLAYQIAVGLFGLALIALTVHLLPIGFARGREGESWALLVGGLAILIAIVLAAVANLREPAQDPLVLLGLKAAPSSPTQPPPSNERNRPEDELPTIDWSGQLVARGSATRLGDALRWVVNKERGGPLAGIVLLTDGRSNGGTDPLNSLAAARDAEIPLYPVGMGSDRSPRNVRVVDLEAPARVYPNDGFTITGYLQANGLSGRNVRVQLISTADAADAPETVEEERRIELADDGQIQPLQFTITPDAIGRRRWTLRVLAPTEDLEPADNQRGTTVEVVERKNRVMLLAGGPQRDYRFLRNLLFRDPNTTVDVLLQSAPSGAAQEANEILEGFPEEAETLFEYDCIVAFDPDWRQLSDQQIELLDRWVAEKAGGLILVAGPVYTPSWSRASTGVDDQKLNRIRALYPVTFFRRGSAGIQLGRVQSDTVWPLEFTEEGRQASFLWLEESAGEAEAAWSRFPGVYGYQAIRDLKPGARVYARFSDPQTTIGEESPVYMAGQFYGAGRVFYIASGEMWRLRALNDTYFDTFYTKLIREVSQGRLLRDSSRGLLLVDRDRCSLGESITVRATLADAQYRPLTLPTVTASVVHERGGRTSLTLRQITNSEREGMYSGLFTPVLEGDYRIELAIPGLESELLTRVLRVRIPAVEIERPQRHDALLSQMATQSNGVYFVGMNAALGRDGMAPLPNQIRGKDQETYLPGSPDRDFAQRLSGWLMAFLCGVLSLEWLIRRLHRLA